MMSSTADLSPDALMALHDAAHAGLDALFFRSLEYLTALDIDGAESIFEVLAAAIEHHAAAEELAFDGVLTDAAEPPRGASPRIFAPEHRQLESLVASALAALAAFDRTCNERLQRAAVVRGLEPLLRVHHLLGHHFQREQDLIYPFVAPRLGPERIAALMAALAATLRDIDATLARHPTP